MSYRSFDCIVAISKGTADALRKWKPSLNGRIRVIYNGAQLKFDRLETRGEQKGPIQILSVGRIHPSKNYDLCIRAVHNLEKGSFQYSIAGDGEGRIEIETLVDQLNLRQEVRVLGFVPDLRDQLRSADIFLIPSKWEGFGLALIEAMNASLPCILSNVPGLSELIESDGKDGILVDPNDVDDITNGLKRLIEDQELRQRIGMQAFHRSQHFDRLKMIRNYIDLYRNYPN